MAVGAAAGGDDTGLTPSRHDYRFLRLENFGPQPHTPSARLRRAQKNTIWAWTAHPALTGRVGPQAQMNHASPPKGRASAFRECVVALEVSPPYIQ